MMRRRLVQAVRSLGRKPAGNGTSAGDEQRIVRMVDAGCSYDTIRRELGVRSAAIDGALRRVDEGERSASFHP